MYSFFEPYEYYFMSFSDFGCVVWLFPFVVIGMYIAILTYSLFSYHSRIIDGSKSVIKFIRKNGWVDNSNINRFLLKCIKKYPMTVRSCFSIFLNSNDEIENYINANQIDAKDLKAREKLCLIIFDLTVIIYSAFVVVDLFLNFELSFVLCFVAGMVVFTLILRLLLQAYFMYIGIKSKKVYYKALDCLYNGIFLKKVTFENKDNESNVFINKTSENEGEIINTDEIVVGQTH